MESLLSIINQSTPMTAEDWMAAIKAAYHHTKELQRLSDYGAAKKMGLRIETLRRSLNGGGSAAALLQLLSFLTSSDA